MSDHETALLKAILEETSDVVFVKDKDGRYLLAHGDTDVEGNPVRAYIGRTDADIAPLYAAVRRESDLRVMATGTAETYLQDHLGPGGRRTFMITKAPYRGEDGTIIGVLGVAREVGAVVHDFNNLLTAILSFAALAEESLDAAHPARADLREIRDAAHEAAGLTRHLLAFSRLPYPRR